LPSARKKLIVAKCKEELMVAKCTEELMVVFSEGNSQIRI
jgi:hypothetical protein